ncbi:MAG TPA: lipopolysaccharide kinase InaA family protein [Syntrophorhabdales bacterium]|nr:lipopolysaccharide kinase InaA family protein [Syntrophorhabdales bacterium]
MKRLRSNGIVWFLDDEALVPLVEGLKEVPATKRTHETRRAPGRDVFVKYFVEKGLLGMVRNWLVPRGKREYRVGRHLSSLSIPTPSPLGYGLGKRGSFILQEHIEATPFRTAFDEDSRRERLVTGLAALLERLRRERVRHNDLHLENIMVADDGLHLVDLHKTKIKPIGFSRADELANLTHALTMIYDRMTEGEKDLFFNNYGRRDVRPFVERGLRNLRHRWIESKKKRAFLPTSKLVASKNCVYVRGREEAAKGAFLETIKADRKVRVTRHEDHLRKTYRSRRRLRRAWQAHVALEYLEMDVVPRPSYVAKGSLFRGGYVAMEDLGGKGEELDRFLDREYDRMAFDRRCAFCDDLSAFLRGLFEKGVIHADLKACNVFVLSSGFRLLDVEDIFFGAPTEEALKRVLVQLNTSVPGRIAASLRVRFLVKLAGGFNFDRRRMLREVAKASRDREIVYEGVSGLKKEVWQDRRQGSPSPPSHPH